MSTFENGSIEPIEKMQLTKSYAKTAKKHKKWTIHVMFDPRQDGFSFAPAKDTLIIAPYRAKTSSYDIEGRSLDTPECRLDTPMKTAVEDLKDCSIITGSWLLPRHPVALLVNFSDDQVKAVLGECLERFCTQNKLVIPEHDTNTQFGLVFCYKVANLISTYYKIIQNNKSGPGSKKGRPVLRVHIHDWIVGPALIFLRQIFYLDNVTFYFNVYNPVLGPYQPSTPSDSEREAEKLNLNYRFKIECLTARYADIIRLKKPVPNKLIKRQLLRGPDVYYLTAKEKRAESKMRNLEKEVAAGMQKI